MWFSRTLGGARLVDEGFSASVATPNATTNWTESPGTWEEHVMPSPGGRLVTFNSSQPFGWKNPPEEDFDHLSMEVLARVVATREVVRLTTLSDELTAAEKQQGIRTVTADYTWGPDGKQLAVYSVKSRNGAIFSQRIDLLTLDSNY